MIKIKQIYESYIKTLKAQLKDVEDKFNAEHLMYQKNRERIDDMKSFIDKCIINYTFDEILGFRKPIMVNNFQQVRNGTFMYNIEDLRNTVSLRINLHRTLSKYKREITQLQQLLNKLTYKVFIQIIKNFNECIIDEIIKGHEFHMGHNLASILVINKQRVRVPVDWNKSNKLREEIIARGGIPYNKETAPHGEQWLIYHEGSNAYYFRWIKKNVKIENSPKFQFKPNSSTRTDGAIKRLHEYNKQNPLNYLNYPVYGTPKPRF